MSDEDKKGMLIFAAIFVGLTLFVYLFFVHGGTPPKDGKDPCMNQSGVPMYEMPPDC